MKVDLSGLEQFRASTLAADPPAAGAPAAVALECIELDAEQPRRGLRAQELDALARSIAEHGVLEPVSLRTHPAVPGRFVVNRGERRVRAARLAGLATVPAYLDERLDRFAQVVENLQREDLSPFDLAAFIGEREREGLTRAEIARRLAKPASFVTEVAGLAHAPEALRAAFEAQRVRDTRVLYRLARALREQPGVAEALLAGTEPLTREAIDAALAAARPAPPGIAAPADPAPGSPAVAPKAVPRASRRPAPPSAASAPGAPALCVEHAGRTGRLCWQPSPEPLLAEVHFDDGTRAAVPLAELQLRCWTTSA